MFPSSDGSAFSFLVVYFSHLIPSLTGGDQPLRAGRPFERLRLLPVVKLDELLDRRHEILEGIVDAAPETAAGQLPEEALDRVHPGAGGRREVEGPAGMVLQPLRDGRVLVGGVVVQDGADLPACGRRLVDLLEERDELLMPVALGVAADDRPVQDVHRGEQRRGSVPLVLVRHRRGPSRLHRQRFLRPPERLDLRLLVDRENHRPVRRIHVQPDDFAGLLRELRIGRHLELPHLVRREPVADKDAVRRRRRDADLLRQGANRPVRLPVRRTARRKLHKLADLLLGHRRRPRLARLVAQKALDPLLHEPPLPAPDRRLRRAGPLRDRHRSQAVVRQKDDPRPARVLRPAVAAGRNLLEPPALLVRNIEIHSRPHRPASRLSRACSAPFSQALYRNLVGETSH